MPTTSFRPEHLTQKTGLLLLYKSKTEAESDFQRIKDYLGTAFSAKDWRGDLLLITNNWNSSHRNPQDLGFTSTIIWTARDIKYGEAWSSIGSPVWSSIVSDTFDFDIVLQSVAGHLSPKLKVDNITDCNERILRDFCNVSNAVILAQHRA
jgi:hypothetical protein